MTNKTPVYASARGDGESLAERAYTAIRERIISLEIPPGAPIYEERLTRDLGVGRTPIREAVKRLALQNLVTVYPHRGTFASDIKIADLAHIFDVRSILEAHAASRAAQRCTKTDVATLDGLRERLAADHSHGDRDKLMSDDGDVHRFIYRRASNPYLESTLDTYLNLGLRLCYLVLDRWPELPDEIAAHDALLNAIEAGDDERAGTLMRRHIENCARSIEKAL
jgi:DNA-binding GntR family transcriptional regulator